MTARKLALAIATSLLALLAFASAAQADSTICSPGSAAGQCEEPQGLATDFETGRLYVADRANNRIDVFEPDGTFVMAFGWGVDTGANALQTCTTASTCQAGKAGSGAGQFDHPTWIAVDNYGPPASRHDVYVGTDNFHVQRFKPNGEFVKAFGEQGIGSCQFNRSEDPIAVGPEGTVYVADSYAAAPSSFTNRVERFDAEGNCLGEVELFEGEFTTIRNFAVDSAGNSYVTVAGAGGVLRKYGPSGTLLYELDKGTETEGIAVDGANNVFAKQRGERLTKSEADYFVTEYDSNGAVLERFTYTFGNTLNVSALAALHSASGDLFASLEPAGGTKEVKYIPFPPPGPVIMPEACKVKTGALGNTKATLQAEINPEGKATTAHFEYVTEEHFQSEGFAGAEVTDEGPSLGADFDMHIAEGVAELEPETEYRCRVVATNPDGSTTGQEGSFTSLEPLEIGDTTVSDVQTEAATLNAQVNPLEIETTGYFEYVEEGTYLKNIEGLGSEHGFDHAVRAPSEGLLEFGAGKSFALRTAKVSGLKPATSYRFRIIATNAFFEGKGKEGVAGPSEYFRTYGTSAEALPDDRAYELVSPAEKNSAEVAMPGRAGGVFEDTSIRIQAAAGSGDAITYTSFTSFGNADSAPAASQYLSGRTPEGWNTENVSPPGTAVGVLVPPYTGFTSDLRFGVFNVKIPALTADCPEEFQGLYLRDNTTGSLRCLTPEAPKKAKEFGDCFTYAGASEDGSRAFFTSTAAYGDAPIAQGYSLYEWSEGDGLQLVSVLPDGEVVEPTVNSSFGAGGGSGKSANCQTGQAIRHHVVSADGSRAFWTYAPDDTSKPSQLFARVNGSETIQLDAVQSGNGKPGNGVFWAASKDGSVVFFTDESRLVSGSKSEKGAPDLYRYELGEPEPLTNVTKASAPAGVEGVVGASDDGSYVYFVAKGVLSSQPNKAGDEAEAGKSNLYLSHGGKTSFIAILAPSEPYDAADWSDQPRSLSARVTPDGHHVAFLSIEAEALAGYDNTVAEGEHCTLDEFRKLEGGPLCPQAFIYDDDTGQLTCASCNPTGARPLGPTLLPGWTNPYEGPRYLSEDGSRFFFETFDALSLADENAKSDVYEFELPGSGSCTGESSAFDPSSGGCHFLISSGKSTDETFLIDASSDGRDAFFSTRSRLTGWDPNTNYDIYDAREGGGFPEPLKTPICQGEACREGSSSTPKDAGPFTTSNVQGTGNPPPPKACAKGKMRRKGRCTKPRKQKAKQRKSQHKGRAGR